MTDREYIWAFEEYRMKVFYFCRKLVITNEDAEDVASMVFIKIWQKRSDVPYNQIEAHLMAYARNKCLDVIKAKNRYAAHLKVIEEPNDYTSLNDPVATVLNAIYRSMNSLTPQQREVFRLKVLEDRDYPEICAILNIKLQTARTIVHNALERMRKSLKAKGIEGSH